MKKGRIKILVSKTAPGEEEEFEVDSDVAWGVRCLLLNLTRTKTTKLIKGTDSGYGNIGGGKSG